ncbi:MAG: hypothetical protein ABIG96_00810 [Candidatus Micrarchaeota archaeon]
MRFLIAALLVLPLVFASGIVLDEQHASACATDQLVLSGIITNTKSLADSYDLRVESDEGLSAYVTPRVQVDGYGTERFSLFLSPVCLDAGMHSYKVIAEGARGEVLEGRGSLEVDDCNLMELAVSQDKARVCNGESADFAIAVRNLGREEQNFTLSTNLEKGTYSISQEKFLLSPYGTGKANLVLNIPKELYAQGMLTFKIISESTYSCGSNSREALVSIDVKRCDGATIRALSELSVQAATEEKWTVFIDNKKTADVYDLKLDCPGFAVLPVNKVDLETEASKSIDIRIKPDLAKVGEYKCTFSATSRKFSKAYTASLNLKVVQNYDARIDADSSVRVCSGESAEVTAKLLNRGKANKYVISASGVEGRLGAKEINAAENSVNEFVFYASDSLSVGAHNLEISASSAYVSTKAGVKIIVEECYAAALKVTPQKLELCAGESGSVVVNVANRGTLEESYVLSSKVPDGVSADFSNWQAFRLKSGERKDARMKISVGESVKSGTYSIEVKASGANAGTEIANFDLKILPTEVCHSLKLVTDETVMRTGAGIGKSFRVQVINQGRFAEKVELFLKEKPSWAYITPTMLEILPNSKEEALVYFAPPLNEQLKEFPIVVEVRGKYITQNLMLKVQVIALEAAAESQLDLSAASMPLRIETETEIPMKLTIRNTGETAITQATIFFSEIISIVEQQPFDIAPGESKEMRIVIKIEAHVVLGTHKVMMGIYAKEGFLEREVEFEAIESAFSIEQVYKEKGEEGYKQVLRLKNSGNASMRLVPKSLEGMNFSESEIGLAAGEEKELTAIMKEGNETIYFEDEISGKVYRRRIEIGGEGQITGLFLLSLQKVLPLLVAIVGGIIALYLIISRKEKWMERLNGRKEDIDRKEVELYEESEAAEDVDVPEMKGEQTQIGEKGAILAPISHKTDEDKVSKEEKGKSASKDKAEKNKPVPAKKTGSRKKGKR